MNGERASHVVAFGRATGRHRVVVVVPRLTAVLQGWADTAVDVSGGRRLRDVFTGRSFDAGRPLAVGDLLEVLPVSVLVRR